jgi:hypothetical protein
MQCIFPLQNIWLTHSISTVLLEKLTVPQIVRKFPVFYAAQMFLNMFTTVWHLAILWATRIKVLASHIISFNIHYNILLLPIPSSTKQSLSLGSQQYSVCFALLPHTWYSSAIPWTVHLNIWPLAFSFRLLSSTAPCSQTSSDYALPFKWLSYTLTPLWTICVYLNQCQRNWM